MRTTAMIARLTLIQGLLMLKKKDMTGGKWTQWWSIETMTRALSNWMRSETCLKPNRLL